jgi:hypothetical protein
MGFAKCKEELRFLLLEKEESVGYYKKKKKGSFDQTPTTRVCIFHCVKWPPNIGQQNMLGKMPSNYTQKIGVGLYITQKSAIYWLMESSTSWSLLGPGVEVGVKPNFMKGIHICPLSIVGHVVPWKFRLCFESSGLPPLTKLWKFNTTEYWVFIKLVDVTFWSSCTHHSNKDQHDYKVCTLQIKWPNTTSEASIGNTQYDTSVHGWQLSYWCFTLVMYHVNPLISTS